MNKSSRRRALLVGAYAGLYASLPKVALAQPSADSKWEVGPPLPKAMGEVVGVAIDRSLFVFGGLSDAAGVARAQPVDRSRSTVNSAIGNLDQPMARTARLLGFFQ